MAYCRGARINSEFEKCRAWCRIRAFRFQASHRLETERSSAGLRCTRLGRSRSQRVD